MSTTGQDHKSGFKTRRRTSWRLLSVSAVVVLCRANAASAQQVSVAEQLFQLGREKEQAGAFKEACALFEASAKIEAAPASRLKVAACWEREGKLTATLAELRALLEIARTVRRPEGQEIQEDIEQRIRVIEKRIATLRVAIPAGTKPDVTLDGTKLSEASLLKPIPLDPGTHLLQASTPAGAARSFELKDGEAKTVDVGTLLFPASFAAPAGSTPPAIGPRTYRLQGDSSAPMGSQWFAGVGLTGVGVASLGGALALGIHTSATVDRARESRSDEVLKSARVSQGAAFACLGIGLGAAAAGVALIVLSPSSPKKPVSALRVALHPQGASLQMLW